MKIFVSAAACSLALVACSPAADTQAADNTGTTAGAATPEPDFIPPEAPSDAPTPAASATPAGQVLTLEGLGPVRIGQPLPADGGWKMDPNCSAASSSAYPGAYALVEQDKVRRITVQRRSQVKLIEGIGVGATEQAVIAAFPGFRSEPHKYEPKPAKYLTAPNAAKGDVALRFEIGTDGKVKAMHVGTMPALGYVEGCG